MAVSYCTNISFYFLLKATGSKVRDHPVIEELLKIREIFEQIDSLEEKIKPQIKEVIKIFESGIFNHQSIGQTEWQFVLNKL